MPAHLTPSELGPEAFAALLDSVQDEASGAVVSFLGTVRNHHQGRSVTAITYTAYESMAQQRIEEIVRDLEHSGDTRVALLHRLGRVPVGAVSVAIVAASAHRQEAYAASRTALERLKTEVPIWKREHYADGDSRWREEEELRPRGAQD